MSRASSEAKKNIVEAARWYREAALKGNIEAEFRLARLVSKGAKGLTKDLPDGGQALRGGSQQRPPGIA